MTTAHAITAAATATTMVTTAAISNKVMPGWELEIVPIVFLIAAKLLVRALASRPKSMGYEQCRHAAVHSLYYRCLRSLIVTRSEEGSNLGFFTASTPALARGQQAL